MPQNGDLIKLGTLKVNGTLHAMPTNPVNGGDCVNYNGTAISIENTVSGKALQWIYAKIDGKELLICDRCLVANCTWNNLNSASLIMGKSITIDGQPYKVRSLTGGVSDSDENNEWSKIIELNQLGIGNSNSIWHWQNMYTWCQETSASNSASRAVRGYSSAAVWSINTATSNNTSIGWRPALEILNTAPLISDSDKNLGSYAAPLVKSYSVSEADGEKFSILEQLDGTTIRSLTNQSAGSFTIDLTNRWGSLSKASHTLKVTATDPHGAVSVRTWTFTKTNTPAGKPTINQPLAGQRISTNMEVIFTPSADPDGDNQYFTLEIADDANFIANKKTVTAGLKKYNSTSQLWESASFATSADVGKQFKLSATGLNSNGDKYIRVATNDTNGSNILVYSSAVKVSVGTRLSFKTWPQQFDYKPVSATIRLSGIIDTNATIQIEVCNNALDSSPIWENATAAYIANTPHEFTNTTKTAAQWAVATKVTIDAKNSTGEISVSAVGLGVK